MGEGRRGPGLSTAPARDWARRLLEFWARRLLEYWGRGSPLGVVGPCAERLKYSEQYRIVQVPDVVRARRNSERTGPLRRSMRLSTLAKELMKSAAP